jgi:hypothetical protein
MEFSKIAQESNKVFTEIIGKCWEDESFKQSLIESPEATLEAYTGSPVRLPEGVQLVVNDQTDDNVIYFNIPPQVTDGNLELSDEQLEMVAGGDVIALGTLIVTALCAGAAGGYLFGSDLWGDDDCK